MLRKTLIFGSAALTGSLAYFQAICYNEQKIAKDMDSAKKFNEKFDPNVTNAVDISMGFSCKGTKNCIGQATHQYFCLHNCPVGGQVNFVVLSQKLILRQLTFAPFQKKQNIFAT